jgi:hypothetical protein
METPTMVTTSLWWNEIVVGAALMLAGTAHGQAVKCPSYQEKTPLSTVVLYDGPPEQRADLMPDVSKGSGDRAYASWDVGYIFGSGRNLFLLCRFGDMDNAHAVTVKVEKKVERCVYRTHAGGKPAELSCK